MYWRYYKNFVVEKIFFFDWPFHNIIYIYSKMSVDYSNFLPTAIYELFAYSHSNLIQINSSVSCLNHKLLVNTLSSKVKR